MDPTPELRAILLRRQRKTEGAAAEVALEAGRKSAAREQMPVAPLRRSTIRSSDQGSLAEHPGGRADALYVCQRRRVRVPSWINDCPESHEDHRRSSAPAIQGQWLFMRQGSTESSCKSSPTAAPGRSASEDLRRKLRRAQRERDGARHAAEDAEASEAARSGELEAEAMRLRELVSSLRSELSAARQEVAQRRRQAEQLSSGGAGGSREAASGSSDQRAVAVAESQALAEELCGGASERNALQVRLSSLSAELERQVAYERGLHEELELRKVNEESLQRRLKALHEERVANRASFRRTETDGSAGSSAQQGLHSAYPPPNACFDLDDGAPDADAAAREAEAACAGVSDLEFAYDWGLGLSGRMSVARALQLARWAAQTVDATDADEALSRQNSQESGELVDIYEGPLAELQRAVEVLSTAAARHTTETEDLSTFDQPIASLQAALARMGHEDFGQDEEQEQQQMRKSVQDQNHGDSQPEAEEEDDGNLQAFDLEVGKLQQALRRLSVKQDEGMEEPAPAQAAEHQISTHGPSADQAASAEALEKLGAADGVARDSAEAGTATPATAHFASAESLATPTLLATPATTPPVNAETGGASVSMVLKNDALQGPTEPLVKPAAEVELFRRPDGGGPLSPREAPATLLGAFGALNTAQAVIRQKYSFTNRRRSV